MKITKLDRNRVLVLGACGTLMLASIGLIVRPLLGQQTNGLTLVQTSSNQFQLTLTNTVVGETYVIYRRQALADPLYPWTFYLLGSPSQTVFTVDMVAEPVSFFQSVSGTNWDGDFSPNWEDANPVDPNVGVLSITIESPTNGSTIN